MATRTQILSLYKALLRESQKFSNYNFRSYAIRRVKDGFRDNRVITDQELMKREYDYAFENLKIIRRQIVVGDMYKSDKLVIENKG